jgi:hypothetical protein
MWIKERKKKKKKQKMLVLTCKDMVAGRPVARHGDDDLSVLSLRLRSVVCERR